MKEWIKKHQVSEVECIVPDLSGAARGKIMPASKYTDGHELRLPRAIFLQSITGDYPELFHELLPTDADMYLQPDESTLRLLPWAKQKCAQVIHDCFDENGKAIEYAPRHVLRRVLDLYRAEGWKPVIAPELEFFIVEPNTDPSQPLQPPIGKNGRTEVEGQSYSIDAISEFSAIFADMNAFSKTQNLALDTLIHEEGLAQMEVNLMHGDPLDLADQAFLFKRRSAPLQLGMASAQHSWLNRYRTSTVTRCISIKAWWISKTAKIYFRRPPASPTSYCSAISLDCNNSCPAQCHWSALTSILIAVSCPECQHRSIFTGALIIVRLVFAYPAATPGRCAWKIASPRLMSIHISPSQPHLPAVTSV